MSFLREVGPPTLRHSTALPPIHKFRIDRLPGGRPPHQVRLLLSTLLYFFTPCNRCFGAVRRGNMCRLVVPSSLGWAHTQTLLCRVPNTACPKPPTRNTATTSPRVMPRGYQQNEAGLTVVQVHLQPPDSEAIKLIRHAVDLSG